MMKRRLNLAALGVLSVVTIGSAWAAHSEDNDALAITDAKISLTQAVAAAEQHVGGKAAKAEYERNKGQWVFDVEVVKDTKVMDVKVDPMSGKVLAATEDTADHEDEHDRND